MISFNCVNNYVPKYVPKDLPWYERHCLMTYIDQVKCEELLRDSHNHFKTARIINFDIIRREVAGEKVPDKLLKHCQTVQNEQLKKISKKGSRQISWGCISHQKT